MTNPYNRPIRDLAYLPISSESNRQILTQGTHTIEHWEPPDLSMADGWSLAVKAVFYAIESSIRARGDGRSPAVDLAVFSELIHHYRDIDYNRYPFSLADVCRAVAEIADKAGESHGQEGETDYAMLTGAFALDEPDPVQFSFGSIAPVYSSVKHWLSCGFPVLAGIAVGPDWDLADGGKIPDYSWGAGSVECDDATVIALVGWEDAESSFLYINMDGYRSRERGIGRIPASRVINPADRFELIVATVL